MSFFAEFVHTGNGVTCSDSGFVDLSTAEECSSAVNYAKSFNSKANYKYAGSSTASHKGCVILDSGDIYFVYITGGEKSTATSICRKGNTYFGEHYSVLGK